MENWPKGEEKDESDLLSNMAIVRKIVEIGLAKRDEAGIKIRQMLGKITVTTKEVLPEEYLILIKDELNVASVEFIKEEVDQIKAELDTTITPELREEGLKRELIRFVNLLRKEGSLSLGDQTKIYLSGASDILTASLKNKEADILKDTLSVSLNFVSELPETLVKKEVKIAEEKIFLGLEK